MHARLARLSLAALLALPAAARAVDVGDGKLTLHGSGEWAYERTDENVYYGDDDGDFQTAMFDLALTARPSDRLVITAQLGFDPDEVGIEWVFAEWRFSDAARLRIGEVVQPLGNFAELRFVGTARPFFTLATSVYGPADVGAQAYYGAGVTGDLPFAGGGWGLQYDAYVGALEMDVFEPFEVLEPGADPLTPPAVEETTLENVVGGRLSLTTPLGLVLRASGYHASEGESEVEGGGAGEGGEVSARWVGGLSLGYFGERLWASAEGFTLYEPDSETQVSGYAEAAWFLTSWLQVAGRYEFTRTDLADVGDSSPLLRHDEAALGLNFWFSPELVVKLSAHHAWGTRFVMPEAGALEAEDETSLVFAGAQFTF